MFRSNLPTRLERVAQAASDAAFHASHARSYLDGALRGNASDRDLAAYYQELAARDARDAIARRLEFIEAAPMVRAKRAADDARDAILADEVTA